MRIHLKYLVQTILAVHFSLAAAAPADDFFRAVNVDDARTVGNMLQAGFDPNAVDENGQVGLYLALRVGAPKVVNALLAQSSVKPDFANAVGETPLMMAALRGELDAMRRLLERGAQVNRTGWTPLHYAASGPSVEALQLLLDRGADVEARSPNGTTPLMMASRYGTEDAVFVLLKRGADPKRRNDKDLDAAGFARLGGRESLTRKLESATR